MMCTYPKHVLRRSKLRFWEVEHLVYSWAVQPACKHLSFHCIQYLHYCWEVISLTSVLLAQWTKLVSQLFLKLRLFPPPFKISKMFPTFQNTYSKPTKSSWGPWLGQLGQSSAQQKAVQEEKMSLKCLRKESRREDRWACLIRKE